MAHKYLDEYKVEARRAMKDSTVIKNLEVHFESKKRVPLIERKGSEWEARSLDPVSSFSPYSSPCLLT